jgi:Flp pilus assembly pilin Flp
LCDEGGQTTVEYTLLLAIIVLPLGLVLKVLLSVLCEQYRMVTFIETLPFP